MKSNVVRNKKKPSAVRGKEKSKDALILPDKNVPVGSTGGGAVSALGHLQELVKGKLFLSLLESYAIKQFGDKDTAVNQFVKAHRFKACLCFFFDFLLTLGLVVFVCLVVWANVRKLLV